MEVKSGASAVNPFPGLRPFRDDEGYLFFGRESQVDLMVDKLATRRFLAVVGTSGSGKSSLVNCGLRPALHRGLMASAGIRWRMVQFRPGNNPIRAMARSLAEDKAIQSKFDFDQESLQGLVEASLRTSKRGLSEVYKRAQFAEGTNLLIVVDQFEELFRYSDVDSPATGNASRRSQEATAFVNLLLDAKTHIEAPIYVVLTMRSDFLGECAEFPGLPEAINDGQYLVPRLTRDERRSAIAGPVGVGGAKISPLLLTRLVNDVGDNPDQLSILQHAMNRTWARWKHEGNGKGELDLDDYEAIGTMAHALDQHAEKAYLELSGARQRWICEKIFRALTEKKADTGIRRPIDFARLCELAEASPEEVTAVIDVFRKTSRSFLMPPLREPLEAETVVDISHESLMRLWERLKRWTDKEMQSAQSYRRLSETAARHAAGRAGLWKDPDLQFALNWKNEERPSKSWADLYDERFDQAMSFLTQSEKERDKECQEKEELRQRELQQAQALAEERKERIEQQMQATRRLRGWLGALAGVAALLLFVAGYAFYEKTKATRAEASARSMLAQKNEALQKAIEAEDKAIAAEKRAELRKRVAIRANEEMRFEALRTRNASLDSMSSYAVLADSLLQYSDPQDSARWLSLKGEALMQLGDYEGAEPLLTRVLETAPGDFNARTSRGYLLLLRDKPAAAMRDFEYIRDHIDRKSALNYLNLTLAQARVGEYSAAKSSLARAMDNAHLMEVGTAGEVVIPPEINQATGRTTLQADQGTFEAALYYMQANLEAYEGNAGAFQDALKRADKNAEPLSSVSQKDAYFLAMTWAWLNIRDRCPDPDARCDDYGALASEAALWERADYKSWAGCYYQNFQQRYERWHDPKYATLNALVEEKRRALGLSANASCPKPREPDALTLETQAKEAVARKKFHEANTLYDQALAKAPEPDKMRLLLGKAEALFLAGRAAREKGRNAEANATFTELKNHCDLILKKYRREAKGYFWHAVAEDWLDERDNREIIVADLKRALAINPADVGSLALLDDLTPDYESGADIQFLKDHRFELTRYYRMAPYTSRVFLHQAKLAEADKDYEQALKCIETAIRMKPEETGLYDFRQNLEIEAGASPEKARQDLLMGYLQALFVMQRRDNESDEKLLRKINTMINAERPATSAGK